MDTGGLRLFRPHFPRPTSPKWAINHGDPRRKGISNMCIGFNTNLCCGLELHQLLRSMHCFGRHLLQVFTHLTSCLFKMFNVDSRDKESSQEIYCLVLFGNKTFSLFLSNPLCFIFRLYCYAQKHVRSIRAVTRTGHDESQQQQQQQIRITPPSSRRYGGKKKFIIKRSPHQLAAYNTSDRKAAVTVGVIMGVFLGESNSLQLHLGAKIEKNYLRT